MHILARAQQKTFTTPNATVTPLATPSLGATQTTVFRQYMTPGHQNPPHSHSHEEVMVMLSGQVTVTVGSDTTELHAGDVLTVPAETRHSIANTARSDAEWLIISPVGMNIHGPDGQLMEPDWAK